MDDSGAIMSENEETERIAAIIQNYADITEGIINQEKTPSMQANSKLRYIAFRIDFWNGLWPEDEICLYKRIKWFQFASNSLLLYTFYIQSYQIKHNF